VTVTYTVASLVDDTIEHLLGTARSQLNLLKTALLTQSTDYVDTVAMSYNLNGAVPGAYLSIGDSTSTNPAETMTILAVNEGTNTCTVLRGQKGSTASAWPANTVIEVDPPWPRFSVMKALRDELRSWGPQVFQVKSVDIATQTLIRGYDLGSIEPYFRVLDVLATPPPTIGSPEYVIYPSGTQSDMAWPSVPFHEIHSAPGSSIGGFTSGSALIVESFNGVVVPGYLHVIYAAPFDVDDSWTESTDCIANVGLDSSDLDIPCYGAAWRLLSFRQVRRMFTNLQGQPRDAQEVPALAIAQAAQGFKALRDSRLGDAQYRLMNRFPTRMSVY